MSEADQTDAEKAALEHLARHKELELEYSDSAHIGIFLAGAAWAAPKWISVKERLPETENKVVVYRWTTNETYFATCNFRDQKNSRRWEINGMEYFPGRDNISHWMPLPEPPKEEEIGK